MSTQRYRLIDPVDSRNYAFDWSEWLADQTGTVTITDSSWGEDSGDLTIVTDASTDTTATVRLADAVAGTVYTVHNTITCSDGQIVRKSFTLACEVQ